MTTAADIMARCKAAGVTLQADGGRLRYRPADAVDDGLRNELRQHKAELLRALQGHGEAPAIPCRQPEEWDFSDTAAVEATLGLRPVWTPRPGKVVPGVPPGWTPERWVSRLRQLADICQENRPDLAERHRLEADRIFGELAL